jgi:NADH-quinone oxidoreductase subunit N
MDISLPVLNADSVVAPQLVVAGTGMLLMVVDATFRRGSRRWAGMVALLGLAAASAWAVASGLQLSPAIGGALVADGLSLDFGLVLLGAAALSVLVAMGYLQREGLERAEYYVLILFATAGALAMAAAADLIVLFIGLEVLSISLYALSAFATGDAGSREAGIKYLLLGAFASAFLLYGIVLVYGATATTRLAGVAQALRTARLVAGPLFWTGAGLLAVGLAFKLALVPFHTWAPDVYQGAPFPAAAFMSVVPKVAAFAALARVLLVALSPAAPIASAILAALAVLTMTVGNLLSLAQEDLKRTLAYSGIVQAGYVLVALVPGSQGGAAAVLFYLLGYALTNLGAFAVVTAWSCRGQSHIAVHDLAGMGFRRPWMAAALALFLLSLAGIPLTAGFAGRFQAFDVAMQAGWRWLVVVAALNSVVSALHYLEPVVLMYRRRHKPALAPERTGWALGIAVAVCAAGVLVLGVLPGPALAWARQALSLVLG